MSVQSWRLLHQRRSELPLHRPLLLLLLAKPRAWGAGSRGRREAVGLGSPQEGAGSGHSTVGVRPVPQRCPRGSPSSDLPHEAETRRGAATQPGGSRPSVGTHPWALWSHLCPQGLRGRSRWGRPDGVLGSCDPAAPGAVHIAPGVLRAALRDRQGLSQQGQRRVLCWWQGQPAAR